MSILKNLPVLGLVLLAACGGGEPAAETETPAAEPAATPAAEAPAATPAAAPATGNVIEVRMVTTNGGASGVYEPAQVTAKVGDVIRFINDGGAAHNASFPADKNPGKTGLPAAGPLLVQAGATYDVPVTFAPGDYTFQCDPHVAMGMVGQLTVTQ